MTTAGDILQRELEAMGADAWAEPVAFCAGETGLIKESEDFTQCDKGVVYKIQADAVLIEDTAARPAWRDGDGWFVLPDGWLWDGESFADDNIALVDPHRQMNGFLEWRLFSRDGLYQIYTTAPAAFCAAEAEIRKQQPGHKETT